MTLGPESSLTYKHILVIKIGISSSRSRPKSTFFCISQGRPQLPEANESLKFLNLQKLI